MGRTPARDTRERIFRFVRERLLAGRPPILLPDPHEVRILGKVIEVRRTLDD